MIGFLYRAAVSEEQTAKIIDGKAVAAEIKAELKTKVDGLKEKYGKVSADLINTHTILREGSARTAIFAVRMEEKVAT